MKRILMLVFAILAIATSTFAEGGMGSSGGYTEGGGTSGGGYTEGGATTSGGH